MKRLPFRIVYYIWDEEKCSFIINKSLDDGYNSSEPFHLEMPADFADFIHSYCTCAYCGSTISKDLTKCTCAESMDSKYHLKVSFTTDIDNTVFNILKSREISRVGQYLRSKRIKDNGGVYTKDEILGLYKAQKELCYYCGKPISGNRSSYHIDHYVPIYLGGDNSIDNIVLTCPKCNLEKGIMDGDEFERVARKKRKPEVGRKLGVIRRQVNKFKNQ